MQSYYENISYMFGMFLFQVLRLVLTTPTAAAVLITCACPETLNGGKRRPASSPGGAYTARNIKHTTPTTPSPKLMAYRWYTTTCLVISRPTKLMIPARLTCPDGWTKEYSGYLMAQHRTQTRTTYVCVDNDPEVIEGGAANQNGVLFYNVEAVCGSLPCPNYVDGWEVTRVVCTK